MGMTDRSQSPYILHPAQVVGAGQVDAEGAVPRLLQSGQGRIQGFWGHRTGAEAAALPVCRGATASGYRNPARPQRTAEPCGHSGPPAAPVCPAPPEQPGEPGTAWPGCTGKNPRSHKRCPQNRTAGGIGLALGNDPLRLIQLVRPGDLGQIPGLAAQRTVTLVPRHMQPGYPRFGIGPDKIRKRGWRSFAPLAVGAGGAGRRPPGWAPRCPGLPGPGSQPPGS